MFKQNRGLEVHGCRLYNTRKVGARQAPWTGEQMSRCIHPGRGTQREKEWSSTRAVPWVNLDARWPVKEARRAKSGSVYTKCLERADLGRQKAIVAAGG